MRVLLVALCCAATAAFAPATSALAWSGPGSHNHIVRQSNTNVQAVNCGGGGGVAVGLVALNNTCVPINVGIGLNLNQVLSGINVLGNQSNSGNQ